MFLRPHFRTVDGKRHAYWALVESVRTERGPRQRVVAYLGDIEEAERLGVQQAAEPRDTRDRQQSLFDEQKLPRYAAVDVSKVRVENCREFGGPWLAWQLIQKLGLEDFLQQSIPTGKADLEWAVMSLVLVIARLCHPSSELHIAEHFYRQTALSDILGVPEKKVNESRLYRTLDALLPHKEALEVHLKNRLGELFNLEYDLLLYDVTSTYFGGTLPNPQHRRDPADENRHRHPQTLHHKTNRPPGDPAAPPEPDAALVAQTNRRPVVEKTPCLPLRRNNLHRQLANLG